MVFTIEQETLQLSSELEEQLVEDLKNLPENA